MGNEEAMFTCGNVAGYGSVTEIASQIAALVADAAWWAPGQNAKSARYPQGRYYRNLGDLLQAICLWAEVQLRVTNLKRVEDGWWVLGRLARSRNW